MEFDPEIEVFASNINNLALQFKENPKNIKISKSESILENMKDLFHEFGTLLRDSEAREQFHQMISSSNDTSNTLHQLIFLFFVIFKEFKNQDEEYLTILMSELMRLFTNATCEIPLFTKIMTDFQAPKGLFEESRFDIQTTSEEEHKTHPFVICLVGTMEKLLPNAIKHLKDPASSHQVDCECFRNICALIANLIHKYSEIADMFLEETNLMSIILDAMSLTSSSEHSDPEGMTLEDNTKILFFMMKTLNMFCDMSQENCILSFLKTISSFSEEKTQKLLIFWRFLLQKSYNSEPSDIPQKETQILIEILARIFREKQIFSSLFQNLFQNFEIFHDFSKYVKYCCELQQNPIEGIEDFVATHIPDVFQVWNLIFLNLMTTNSENFDIMEFLKVSRQGMTLFDNFLTKNEVFSSNQWKNMQNEAEETELKMFLSVWIEMLSSLVKILQVIEKIHQQQKEANKILPNFLEFIAQNAQILEILLQNTFPDCVKFILSNSEPFLDLKNIILSKSLIILNYFFTFSISSFDKSKIPQILLEILFPILNSHVINELELNPTSNFFSIPQNFTSFSEKQPKFSYTCLQNAISCVSNFCRSEENCSMVVNTETTPTFHNLKTKTSFLHVICDWLVHTNWLQSKSITTPSNFPMEEMNLSVSKENLRIGAGISLSNILKSSIALRKQIVLIKTPQENGKFLVSDTLKSLVCSEVEDVNSIIFCTIEIFANCCEIDEFLEQVFGEFDKIVKKFLGFLEKYQDSHPSVVFFIMKAIALMNCWLKDKKKCDIDSIENEFVDYFAKNIESAEKLMSSMNEIRSQISVMISNPERKERQLMFANMICEFLEQTKKNQQ